MFFYEKKIAKEYKDETFFSHFEYECALKKIDLIQKTHKEEQFYDIIDKTIQTPTIQITHRDSVDNKEKIFTNNSI